MGRRYFQHSDMCGCERCARQFETDNPRPVYDSVEDADYLACGCRIDAGCTCGDWDSDDPPEDEE